MSREVSTPQFHGLQRISMYEILSVLVSVLFRFAWLFERLLILTQNRRTFSSGRQYEQWSDVTFRKGRRSSRMSADADIEDTHTNIKKRHR